MSMACAKVHNRSAAASSMPAPLIGHCEVVRTCTCCLRHHCSWPSLQCCRPLSRAAAQCIMRFLAVPAAGHHMAPMMWHGNDRRGHESLTLCRKVGPDACSYLLLCSQHIITVCTVPSIPLCIQTLSQHTS